MSVKERTERIAAALVAVGVLVACGSAAAPETTTTALPASPATTLIPAISTTIQETTTTMPASGPVLVESTLYLYALTVPAEEILAPFKPATVVWDGSARVTRDRPFLDVLALSDGFVFIFGVEWPDDVESLAQMLADRYEQDHGCSPAMNQREVTVGGASAIVFTVDSCGPENALFARLVALHDGFGLIAFTPTSSGEEGADMDQLVESLAGLEWRTS